YCQEPGEFQGLLEVRAEIRKLKPSALGFCLSMRFDQCAEARAVNIIDVLEINDNSRSEEHTSELQSRFDLVCRLLLEKKNYPDESDADAVARAHDIAGEQRARFRAGDTGELEHRVIRLLRIERHVVRQLLELRAVARP